jgi:undecaprenyl-diphosphatase
MNVRLITISVSPSRWFGRKRCSLAFLLATPIIFAAALLKLPALALVGEAALMPIPLGSVCAAGAAYLSVRFLSRYFKTHMLLPFALYCMGIGLFALFIVH